jgi:RND family efflux transporter MFP subunit
MTTDLSALSRAGSAFVPSAASIPRPPRRLATRVLVPALVVLAALALIGYAARESFRKAVPVTVAPAVLRAGGGTAGTENPAAPGEVVQAPGWIEADPNAVGVPALAAGVLKEIRVLDGERVEAGQVVAVLVDEDAVLARHHAEAQVAMAAATIIEARAAITVEQARLEEARAAYARVEHLTGKGLVGEGDITDRRLRVATQAASLETARAAVARAEAEERAARVAVEQADLALARMQVRAPVGGVVLQRMVEPGQRLMPDANNPYAAVVVRLYDPAHLQVRVDIPLADAAKVRTGDKAEITTETLPGRTFTGTLTRFVHEANIQKNTVQVKVAIADPAPELKPDMLAKAKITTRPAERAAGAMPTEAAPAGEVVMVPRAALVEVSGAQASAWVIDLPTTTALKRALRLGQVTADSAEVLEGLRPGDRVVLHAPADLRPGVKVRAVEATEKP